MRKRNYYEEKVTELLNAVYEKFPESEFVGVTPQRICIELREVDFIVVISDFNGKVVGAKSYTMKYWSENDIEFQMN